MGRKKGVILSYVLMLFEIASTLLLTPYIIRSLGGSEYGVYKLTASVAAYLMLLDMGVGNAIVRYISKYRATGEIDQQRRFFGVAQIYYAIIALVAGVCGMILIWVFPTVFAVGLTLSEIELGQMLLTVITLNTVLTLATAVYPNIIIGYGLFSISRYASILQIIVRMVVTTIALGLGCKSLAIVTINLVLTVLLRGGFAIYVIYKLKLRPMLRGVTRTFIMGIVGYSTWILVQMVATQINAFADQVLLGIFIPGAATIIAVYGVGIQVVQYFQSIGTAFSGVLMPGVVVMVENGASPKELQTEMVRIGRVILIVLLAILGCFLIYGQQFIQLWVGIEYAQAYYVTILLMIAYTLIQTQTIGAQILWAKNQHKEQAILKFAIVLVNIALTIALIHWNPFLGATIGTFLSLMLGDILVMNIVFKRYIGISLRGYYYGLFKGVLFSFTISVAFSVLFAQIGLQGWTGFIINGCVFSATYGLLMYFVGFNKSEKSLFRSLTLGGYKRISNTLRRK